jgi:hypothetical protein
MVSRPETPNPLPAPGQDGSGQDGSGQNRLDHGGGNAAQVRPTVAQRRYLERGLREPGGKLPLFDPNGREVPRKTIEACIGHGWAEPWTANPIKPDWLVCRLTPAGRRILADMPPDEIRRPADEI